MGAALSAAARRGRWGGAARRGQRRTAAAAAACGFSRCPSWAETAATRAGGAAAGEARAQLAGQTVDSGQGAAPWAELEAGARAGGRRHCCCFWGPRWFLSPGPRQVGTDCHQDPSDPRPCTLSHGPAGSGYRWNPRAKARGRGSALPAAQAG